MLAVIIIKRPQVILLGSFCYLRPVCGGQYGDSPLSTSSTWRLGWRSWCLSSFWCLAGSPAGAASVAPSCLVKSLQTFSRHEIESQCGHNSRAPADVKISDFLRKKLFSAVTHHNWFQCHFLKKVFAHSNGTVRNAPTGALYLIMRHSRIIESYNMYNMIICIKKGHS